MCPQFITAPIIEKLHFWAKKNLHFMAEFKRKQPHVIFCAGMTSNSFDLPCLFDEPVNVPSQAKILQVQLITKLRHKRTHEIVQKEIT
jgi:hypothetical protein